MYVVLLRFSANRGAAPEYLSGHQEWIGRGVSDGVFLLVGSIRPGLGGVVVATGTTLEELSARIAADPFVVHDVVTAEILDIDANHTDPRLTFLAA